MLIRTYRCSRCKLEADYTLEADEDKARCRKCGSYRTMQWIPKGGHMLKTLRQNDGYFRKMADVYGLTNLKDAKEGEAMMPTTPSMRPGPPMQMNGVDIPLGSNQKGEIIGGCNPVSLENVKALVGEGEARVTRQPLQDALPLKNKPPTLREQTIIEARWSKEGGEKLGDVA